MRRVWILILLAAGAGAQEFSEDLLDHAIRGVRRREVHWVRRVGPWGSRAERAVPALLEVSWIPSLEFQDALREAIHAIGPVAIPELAKAARSRDATGTWAAARLREFASGPHATALPADREGQFLDLLDDTEPVLRRSAARALATRGTGVVQSLVALLVDASARRRQGAAFALACVDPPPEEALGTLLTAARDKDASVREESIRAAGRLRSGAEERVRCFVTALADPAGGVVAAALEGLVREGVGAVPLLIAAWDAGGAVARHASEGLLRIGDPALEPVLEALRAGTTARKCAAAACLGRMAAARDMPVEAALAAALAGSDVELRLAAADALGTTSPKVAARAIDAVLAATRDADARVRAAAMAASVRIAPTDPRVADALKRVSSDEDLPMKPVVAAAGAASPEQWAAILKAQKAPPALRLLAAEQVGGLEARAVALLEPLSRIVSDGEQPAEVRTAAARALGVAGSRRLYEARFAPRVEAMARPARAAAERAVRWLAATQADNGRWACDGLGRDTHDVGVTGLALLAFLAAGQTDRGPSPQAKNVRDGFAWLLSKQTPEGLFLDGGRTDYTLLEHAIATHALCELIGMTGEDVLREAARRAVDHCIATRGGQGWRYGPRSGDSDTNVTAWMVTALRVADEGGFDVDPACYMGAAQWIDKMTEVNFGMVGYDSPGGSPFRPAEREDRFPPEKSHSMTAAGIHCRILMGEDPKNDLIRKGLYLCGAVPPRWDQEGGSIDMYYWYYGALAMFQAGGTADWKKWNEAMVEALVRHQQAGEPPAGGSWAPLCVWGYEGGSVYSTATCALALLAPWRYPRGWSAKSKPTAAWATVAAALAEAAGSPYEALRTAARQALGRCPGGR